MKCVQKCVGVDPPPYRCSAFVLASPSSGVQGTSNSFVARRVRHSLADQVPMNANAFSVTCGKCASMADEFCKRTDLVACCEELTA